MIKPHGSTDLWGFSVLKDTGASKFSVVLYVSYYYYSYLQILPKK